MDTIKVGIIGAGGIAQHSHIPSYKKVDGVEIVAIADINEAKARGTAEKLYQRSLKITGILTSKRRCC